MAYMRWIAQMLMDNTYEEFKELYIESDKNKYKNFTFEGSNCDTVLAKHVCEYVDTYLANDYEQHLIDQVEFADKYEQLIDKRF